MMTKVGDATSGEAGGVLPLLRASDEALFLFEVGGGRVLGASRPAMGLVGLSPEAIDGGALTLDDLFAFECRQGGAGLRGRIDEVGRVGGLLLATRGVCVRRRSEGAVPVGVVVSRVRGGPFPLAMLAVEAGPGRGGGPPVGCGLELDRVFAVSDALFCLIGLDGTFVRVSPAWEGALGYGPTELQGQPVSRWVGAEDLARAAEAVRRRPHDNPVAFECGFRHRDGKDRRLRGRAVTTGGLVLVSVSVVGEGPADPARGAKAAFLAHVSHEVRTPLALILSNADLALEKGPDLPDADRDDYLRVIRRNAEELLGLLVDVLDLTRLESGDAPVEVVNCPLPALIEEVLEVVRFRAAPRGLDVVFEPLGPVPGVVRTDPDRLRQALRQVLTNAELLTDWGGVRLRFRHAAGPGVGDAPGRLVFEVSDTGGGLPPLEVGEAFPASDRAGSSRVRSIRSAGVGLALCRRLVEPLGGRLETWYSQGAGTVIALSLPVTAPPAPPPPEPEARPAVPAVGHTPGVPGAEGGPAGFDARALVAEDNPDNQKIVRMRLSMMGALVTVASNGLEAVELARAARDAGDPFDLILMDMQMPVLDGYGATRMLRDEGFRTPVVAMTAFAMPGDREECLSFGCDDYVSKPVDWKALQLLLARLLRAAPAG